MSEIDFRITNLVILLCIIAIWTSVNFSPARINKASFKIYHIKLLETEIEVQGLIAGHESTFNIQSELHLDSEKISEQDRSNNETRIITNNISENSACPMKPKTISVEDSIIPLFKLNADKFIIPILTNGPSNQLGGLKETIALAIRFNRTLVMPDLYYHFTDPHGHKSVLDPSMRISITHLRKLLPVISSSELCRICPNGSEAIWPARKINMENLNHLGRYIHYFEHFQGMNITDHSNGNVMTKLSNGFEKMTFRGKIYPTVITSDWSDNEWDRAYGESEEKCAVRLFAFNSMKFRKKSKDSKHHMDSSHIEKLILQHIKMPEYVDRLTKYLFNSVEVKIDYSISLHWRYNLGDWMEINPSGERKCSFHKFEQKDSCENLERALRDPKFIARAILYFLQNHLAKKETKPKLISLFLACPSNTAQIMDEAKTEILVHSQNLKLPTLSITTSADIENFYDKKVVGNQSCEWVANDWYEIKSTVERYTVEKADVFIYAEGSTWSTAVKEQRKISQNLDTEHDYGVLRMLHDYSKV